MEMFLRPLEKEFAELESEWRIRVADIRQYAYCPRVVYHEYCFGRMRPSTYKMQHGLEAEDFVEELEKRRSLREYGVTEGVRHFHVALTSRQLGCTALIDLVVESNQGGQRKLIPVDFKMSRREPGRHQRLQLACYGMMLEESWGAPAMEGILYLIPLRRAVHVGLDKRLRRDAERMLAEIRETLLSEHMPAATPHRSRCVDCEFRRFCNDVL